MAKLVGCRIYNSGALTISDASLTALTFDSERYDYDTMHSTSTNTNRITFTTAGIYSFGANVRWDGNATGYRLVSIRLGGSTFIAGSTIQAESGANVQQQFVSGVYYFSATNYIEVMVFQNSTGSLDVTALGNISPEAWAQRIG